MKSIAVFCGAGEGNKPVYAEAARLLGAALAGMNIQLVYGGARIGLMGAVADAALLAGGSVVGVIPQFLKTKEVAHTGLTELITVDNMHERKLRMHELSDGIITLPGGWGTMEEVFEMLTWGQLGLHTKPIGILNVNGYYNALSTQCDIMVAEGFLNAETRKMLLHSDNIEDLLNKMHTFIPVSVPKWISETGT
ncbi:MAG: TIGR00730 family Rossman fold protein [Taibaiella sp.]|nr:TIGR00730 family Rossman fold protein [Taibaiella sp.]